MKLELRTLGRSFATRERAQQLLPSLIEGHDLGVTVDASGVLASPSFLAELLVGLDRADRVVTVTGDQYLGKTVTKLIRQLSLSRTTFREAPISV